MLATMEAYTDTAGLHVQLSSELTSHMRQTCDISAPHPGPTLQLNSPCCPLELPALGGWALSESTTEQQESASDWPERR